MNKHKFFILVLFIASLNLSSCLIQVKAATETIEIKATQDAYVSQNYPDTNYGPNQTIRLWYSPVKDGFLSFNLISIMEKNYTSVMLRINICQSTATTLQLFPVEQLWDEDTITWNNVPNVNMGIMCSQYFPVRCGYSYINVTTIVSNWTSGIISNFGFFLRTTINGLGYYSKEYSNEDYHPTLEFTVPAEDNSPSTPSIAGFEVIITLFGMLGVTFVLLIKNRQIRKKIS